MTKAATTATKGPETPKKKKSPHARHGSATATSDGGIIAGPGYVLFEKMRWRTPDYVMRSICEGVGIERFDLDAAAEDDARWADRWITHTEDCLRMPDWRVGHRYKQARTGKIALRPRVDASIRHVFLNSPWGGAGVTEKAREAYPKADLAPFPGTAAFVDKAIEQAALGMTVVVLVGLSGDAWQLPHMQAADELWFGPRVRYLDVQGCTGAQPPAPSIVLVYRPPGEQRHLVGPRLRFDWCPKPPKKERPPRKGAPSPPEWVDA